MGSHLQHPAHSDTNWLTSPDPKMILVTYESDAHPTTREPAGNVGPHRYLLHQDNNTTARIDPTRCSVKPTVSLAATGPAS